MPQNGCASHVVPYIPGTCFMARDVSEKYQYRIHRPLELLQTWAACNVNDKYFCAESIRYVMQPRQANTSPSCPHSLNTFQDSSYQKRSIPYVWKRAALSGLPVDVLRHNFSLARNVKEVTFCLFLGAFANLRIATVSFVMCVCPSSVSVSAWNNSAPTGRIFMAFYIWIFFKNLSRKFQVSSKSDKNKEDQYTFSIISRSFLLRMKFFFR